MAVIIYPKDRLDIWLEKRPGEAPGTPSLVKLIESDGCILEVFDTYYGREYDCAYGWECEQCLARGDYKRAKQERSR